MDYKMACVRCGYRLPVLWRSSGEMLDILTAAGWKVTNIRQGAGICPRCRMEDENE